MNRETLLAFIQRILESSSELKSRTALDQLSAILQAQNADPSMIDLVQVAIDGMPEAKDAAEDGQALTEEALRIALQRADARRLRELEAARQSRC